jgi:glycosyltransferase involved in cell wall biosynthesis
MADRLDRNGRATGVGAYVAGLLHGIELSADTDDYVAFSWGRQPVAAPAAGHIDRLMLPWPRTATAASWTLFGRPRVRNVRGHLDLVHLLVPTTPVASGTPMVATIHDLMPLKHPQLFAVKARLLFREAIRRVCRDASWVITNSEATKRDVVALTGFPEDGVSVIYPGVPLHFSRATPMQQSAVRDQLGLQGSPIVLFVGEVAARKNVRVLVEAFAAARPTVPDSHLVLVGSAGVGAADVVGHIERTGLGSCVTWLGHVAQTVVDALVATAAVLVLPSVDEGFGFPALEAMSAATPVIVSDSGSLPEVVGDAGIVVPVNDVEALAAALLDVLTDPQIRTALASRGVERAQSFSWRSAARQTIEVYGNALGT